MRLARVRRSFAVPRPVGVSALAVALGAAPRGLAAQGARVEGPAVTSAPAVVTGRVVDAAERPLGGVTVALQDAELSARTDRDGTFLLVVDFVDSAVVTFRRVGYAPAAASVRLARGDTLRLVARLAPVAVLETVQTLGTVATGARFSAFEERRARGRGTFITRDEIERRAAIGVADLLRWSGAVSVVDSGGALLAVSRRGAKWDGRRGVVDAPCVLRVAVDGIMMPAGFSLRELPLPREVGGVEIYRGPASLPPEFAGARSDAFCGLVAIWTRGG